MAQTTLRQLDDNFEYFLDSLTFEEKETELTPKLKKQRREKADKSDKDFCKIYFPQIFNAPWNGIHDYLDENDEGNHFVSGSRRYGKTAFSYISKIVKKIALGKVKMIGLTMRTGEDSKERTAAIVRLMIRNPKLMYDYDINVQQDKKGYYIINNVQFHSLSVEKGIRNYFTDDFQRFDVIINDDLFNRQTVKSDKDNESVYNFVTSESWGQTKPGGLNLWLFNLISENSPGSRAVKEFPEKWFNLPAWDENEETNWPGSEYTTEELHRLSTTMPMEVWKGDWLNEPVLNGEIFDVDWIKFFNINSIKIVASLTAIDPSIGASPNACFKGMITMGVDSDRQYYITDIYIRKEDYLTVFDYIDNLRLSTPHWKILLFENDFNQWFSAKPYYERWEELRKKHLPIVQFSAKDLVTAEYGTDKESRIMNLVYPHQHGIIKINQDLEKSQDFKKWRNQYIGFNKAKEKDALDAEATAYIMLPRYIELGTFKSLGQRLFKDDSFINRITRFRR